MSESDSSASDAALLRSARVDRAAFGEFYERYALQVFDWFRRSVVDDEQAAYDLTAETFAQALVSLHRFRGRDDGDGQAWLFGIARNLGRHFHRDRGIEARARRRLGMPITELSPEYEELEDRLMAQGLGPEVADALGRLSVDQQTAVRLRVVDGLGYAQIAASMGSTEAAARLRVSRALRALRVALDHERGKG